MAASSSLSADELAAWLRLLETPGLGRQAVRRLLAAFGSPQAACAAAPQARRHLLSAPAAQALEHEPPQLAGLVARTLGWLQADARHHVLTLGDPAYPCL
ncbi:MAG: DNA-protecting protein DprA, partial [Caldimonas manganoxidans]|nr:DNA-protecting protein DprA [Caldimonas manganoxidans]